MRRFLVVLGLLTFSGPSASAQPRFAAALLPQGLTKVRLQGLLQRFVDDGYGKSFRHLGDERDFDHGHLLFSDGKPVAILYHTQETAHAPVSPDYGYLDTQGRNWIQWLDSSSVENARRYERTSYPRSGVWDWFLYKDLPALKERHTITDRMLDPVLLGRTISESRQWTFTRVGCADTGEADPEILKIRLPGRSVCLALGS